MASSFEVKAVVRGWMHKLATTPCLLFRSVLSILSPLFLLLFQSTAERTSELEDAVMLMGNFSLFPFLPK